MEQVNLYEEFERVFTDPDPTRRETDTERQHTPRNAKSMYDTVTSAVSSYALRVLNLLCKPHEQWDGEDRAFAARAIEDARFTLNPIEEGSHRPATFTSKQRPFRDEFDRRLWGLPPRPCLSGQ